MMHTMTKYVKYKDIYYLKERKKQDRPRPSNKKQQKQTSGRICCQNVFD